jgi:hypothetical protein
MAQQAVEPDRTDKLYRYSAKYTCVASASICHVVIAMPATSARRVYPDNIKIITNANVDLTLEQDYATPATATAITGSNITKLNTAESNVLLLWSAANAASPAFTFPAQPLTAAQVQGEMDLSRFMFPSGANPGKSIGLKTNTFTGTVTFIVNWGEKK